MLCVKLVLAATVASGQEQFTVQQILTYTGSVGFWVDGTDGYLSYRLGCPDGSLATPVGTSKSPAELLMDRGGVVTPIDPAIADLFVGYFDLDDPVRDLNVQTSRPGETSVYIPASSEATFQGCSEPAFIELLYLSTNGWEIQGLTVVVNGVGYSWLPETAWPKLYSQFDDYDSVFLDLDDNYTDTAFVSDPAVRTWLSKSCDAILDVQTGSSGAWAPGPTSSADVLHYKLLNPRGVPLVPARGPPPFQVNWEPAHPPFDDLLTTQIYGGLWSSKLDWQELDATISQSGALSRVTHRGAWDCGGPFVDAASEIPLGGIELVYGNTEDGWELDDLTVTFEGTTYSANFATEYPALYATFDNADTVFFDYNSKCNENHTSCESDWYMRFQFLPASTSSGGGGGTTTTPAQQQLTTCGTMTVSETWGNDATLTCLVTVASELTILAGTTIIATKIDAGLVVLPGARLIAEGTAEKPITFRGGGSDIPPTTYDLWTGIALLGRAPTSPGASTIFGSSFGGVDTDDSSGVLRYVRIYNGGGTFDNDEAALLTLAGVGKGTVIEHFEVAFGLDDGFQFNGGTVDAKYISALWIGDDSLDIDDGYQGRIQFFFTMLDSSMGNHAIEADSRGSPRSFPKIFSATILVIDSALSDSIVQTRGGVGGSFANFLVVSSSFSPRTFLDEVSCGSDLARVQDPNQARFRTDTNYFYFPTTNVVANIATIDTKTTDCGGVPFTADTRDPLLARLPATSLLTQQASLLDPRPVLTSIAYQNIEAVPVDDFFVATTYKGAFSADPYDFWLSEWSWLHEAKKIDIYNDLSGTTTPGAVPVAFPTQRPVAPPVVTAPPTCGATDTFVAASTSKKSSTSSSDSSAATATITFFAGLVVGAAILASVAALRDPSCLKSRGNSNARGHRRPNRYETLGVELTHYDDVDFT